MKSLGATVIAISVSILGGSIALADGKLDVIAWSGEPSPDGENLLSTFLYRGNSQAPEYIHDFYTPVVNDRGQVAFWAAMADTLNAYASDTAILVGNGSELRLIARKGLPLTEELSILGGLQPPSIDAEGGTWFTTAVAPSPLPELSDAGLIYGSEAGLDLALRTPFDTPDGNGFVQFLSAATANQNGQVAFGAGLLDTAGGSDDLRAIYVLNDDTVKQIARAGELAPDGETTFGQFLGDPALNNAGQIAFYSRTDGNTGGYGLYLADGSVIRQIAREGEPVVIGGDVLTRIGGRDRYAQPALSNAGEIAFTGYTADGYAIYLSSGAELTTLFASGEPATNGKGTVGTLGLRGFNDASQAAVSVEFGGTTGTADSRAIYRVSRNEITQLARSAARTPDDTAYFEYFFDMAINDAGLVAYHATLTPTLGGFSLDNGIYLTDGIETIEVVRFNQAVENRAASTLSFGSSALHGETYGETLDPSRRPLNNFGQVAFHTQTTGPYEAVELFTPTLHWRSHDTGAWDDHLSWTLGISPHVMHDVVINPNESLTIAGPAEDVSINSLTLGPPESAPVTLDIGGDGDIHSEDSIAIGSQGTLRLSAGHAVEAPEVHNDGRFTGSGTVVGGFEQSPDGTLAMEIAGIASDAYDRIHVSSDVKLRGTLELTLVGDYEPALGDTFPILSAGGNLDVRLDHVLLPDLEGELSWRMSNAMSTLTISVGEKPLAGDYNGDGTIDAADYVVWRIALGTANIWADGNGDGTVGPQDFTVWRLNFGRSQTADGAAQASVPEPECAVLALLVSVYLYWNLLRRR